MNCNRAPIAIICAALLMALSGISSAAIAADIDKAACTFKGKKLYGKIQFVTSFPDVKIQEVTSFPDVKIEKVNSFPDKCGKWQIVTSFPDTKVQVVSSFPDVKVQYVTSFPGIP
jgi:hypothetical protein